jgi:hypothetical protein
MMEILKNNEGAEGGMRNHASAMTIEDMRKLMSWSYGQCPDELVSQIYQCLQTGGVLDIADVVLAQRHLMVRAFSTTGFTIWTRSVPAANFMSPANHDVTQGTLSSRRSNAGTSSGTARGDHPMASLSTLSVYSIARAGSERGRLTVHSKVFPGTLPPASWLT